MSALGTWRSVVGAYNGMSDRVKNYFPHVPDLVERFPLDVCLAYQFARVELAYNMAIYCGIVKKHRVDPKLAWAAVEDHQLTRKSFREFYETVHGGPITRAVQERIEDAETVRDKIMHGKPVTEAQKRKAIVDVLKYAEALNARTEKLGGVKPFGDLRGFKGRGTSLDKSTSRWILKGMGFWNSNKKGQKSPN